jgi:flagellar biosynthesis protein FlhF
LDAVIRHKMNLFYVANGQRVPEDIHVADREHLVDMAFKLKGESVPFQMHDDELPAIVAIAGHPGSDPGLRGIALG